MILQCGQELFQTRGHIFMVFEYVLEPTVGHPASIRQPSSVISTSLTLLRVFIFLCLVTIVSFLLMKITLPWERS